MLVRGDLKGWEGKVGVKTGREAVGLSIGILRAQVEVLSVLKGREWICEDVLGMWCAMSLEHGDMALPFYDLCTTTLPCFVHKKFAWWHAMAGYNTCHGGLMTLGQQPSHTLCTLD